MNVIFLKKCIVIMDHTLEQCWKNMFFSPEQQNTFFWLKKHDLCIFGVAQNYILLSNSFNTVDDKIPIVILL